MGLGIRGSAVHPVKSLAAVKWQLLGAIKAGHEFVYLYICVTLSKGSFLMTLQVCFGNAVQCQKTDAYLLTQCRAAWSKELRSKSRIVLFSPHWWSCAASIPRASFLALASGSLIHIMLYKHALDCLGKLDDKKRSWEVMFWTWCSSLCMHLVKWTDFCLAWYVLSQSAHKFEIHLMFHVLF